MGFLLDFHRISMGFLWDYYGISIGFLLESRFDDAFGVVRRPFCPLRNGSGDETDGRRPLRRGEAISIHPQCLIGIVSSWGLNLQNMEIYGNIPSAYSTNRYGK